MREMGQTFQCLFLSILLVPKPCLCQNHMEARLIYLSNKRLMQSYIVLTMPKTIINTLQILYQLIHFKTL